MTRPPLLPFSLSELGLQATPMNDSSISSSDIAFTPIVKAIQSRKGSRRAYRRVEANGGWPTRITPDLARFIAEQTSVFLATANAVGQPYVQHRGGPAGFLKVLDDATIAFADFTGNRQYITQGNLEENPRAQLLLIDYSTRQRVKIWGEARVVEGDAELTTRLMPEGYEARPEQAIVFTVKAWDQNCPRHIPQLVDAAAAATALADRDRRIAALEAEVTRLQVTTQANRVRPNRRVAELNRPSSRACPCPGE
jgi:predicted pyridoxine 5'-phosphate oxidase superfamily flavin-nucleotide-binding protein